MAFRFIHAADIHLDSPLLSLEEYPGAPVEEIRGATRKALAGLADLAIESGAAFVVIAGDLFDGEWRDCNTGLYFISQMKRLRVAGIPVYISLGNHDAANRMSQSLPWGDNVRFFDYRKPERVEAAGGEATLYSQSFRSRHITEDLTSAFPKGSAGTFNIGVLHTSATGSAQHPLYAPCSIEGLLSHQYQYWALGHIHTRSELARDPWIVFSGNIQGRSVRECGPRGCYVVDVSDRGGVTLGFDPLDVVRWEVVRLSVDDDTTGEDLEELAQRAIGQAAAEAGDRTLALRFELEGHGSAWNRVAGDIAGWRARLRAFAGDASVPVHVEKLELIPQRAATAATIEPGPAGELRALVSRFLEDPALLEELRQTFGELKTRLETAVTVGEECVDPQDAELLRKALYSIESLLMKGEER
jgi:DNA repair exonuclease SbcCD nuclease subunit